MEGMDALIALGHPPAVVWDYTPRQTAAWLFVAEKRKTSEDRRQLRLQTMAARGDMRKVNQELREKEA